MSITTDSIITDMPLEGMILKGPLCVTYMQARQSIGQPPTVLGTKAETRQLYLWKCRGVATLLPGTEGDVKIARAGISSKYGNDKVVEWIFEHTPGEKYDTNQPISFTKQHEEGLDLIYEDRRNVLNFAYDLKAYPVNVRTARAWYKDEWRPMLAFDTQPWPSLAAFEAERDLFDRWRRTHSMRTLQDWITWQEYKIGANASKAGINRRSGLAGQHRRILIRAVLTCWPGQPYDDIAWAMTKAGIPTTVNHVKKERAKMRKLGWIGRRPKPRTYETDPKFVGLDEAQTRRNPQRCHSLVRVYSYSRMEPGTHTSRIGRGLEAQ